MPRSRAARHVFMIQAAAPHLRAASGVTILEAMTRDILSAAALQETS